MKNLVSFNDSENLIDEYEAASRLGLSPYTLRSWRQRKTGKLPFYKLSKSIRYKEDDVMDLLKSSRVSLVVGTE